MWLQHTSLSVSRSEKGTGWSSRSLGARCRNSIALCSDETPHIGNYRLLKTIGKGNFAKVKLARHILTGREVGLMRAKKNKPETTRRVMEQSYTTSMLKEKSNIWTLRSRSRDGTHLVTSTTAGLPRLAPRVPITSCSLSYAAEIVALYIWETDTLFSPQHNTASCGLIMWELLCVLSFLKADDGHS